MSFYNVEVEGVIVGRVEADNHEDAMVRAKSTYATNPDGSLKKFTVKEISAKHPLVEKVEEKNRKRGD